MFYLPLSLYPKEFVSTKTLKSLKILNPLKYSEIRQIHKEVIKKDKYMIK